MIVSVIIAGLAGARLTRAWSYETIGDELQQLVNRQLSHPFFIELDDDGVITSPPWRLRLKDLLHDLFDCPFCIGFWLTLGCVIALRFKLTRPLVIGLAAAALQSAIVDHYPGFDHGVADED
jgi:hypothetical protein